MNITSRILPLAASLMLFSGAAFAQAHNHGSHNHGAHDHGKPAAASKNPSDIAYAAANAKMHKDMDIKFSGDADVDFIRGMIPHHQGAIDMAKVVLAHGKDEATKKLATEIIAAQEKEIAQMKEWLKAKGK